MTTRPPSARHAPPPSGRAGTGLAGTPRRLQDARARDSRARHAGFRTRPAQDSRAANGPGTPGRHPPGHDGPRSNGPSSQRARRAAPQRAVISAGTPHASGGSAAHHPQVSPPAARGTRLTWRLAAPLAGVWSAADDGTQHLHESHPAQEPRQRCRLHRLVRRARAPGRMRPGRRGPPPGGVLRADGCARRHGSCVGHAPMGRTEGPPGSPAPGTRPHGAPAPATARATPPRGARQGSPQTRRATGHPPAASSRAGLRGRRELPPRDPAATGRRR